MGLPPFHAYGTLVQLYIPLICLVAAVVYTPRAVTDPHAAPVIPTTDNMLNYAGWTECKILMTVPTFLEQWAVSQEYTEELKKLQWVVSSIIMLVCSFDLTTMTPISGICRRSVVRKDRG